MKLKELIDSLGDDFIEKVEEKLLYLMESKPDFIYTDRDIQPCYYNRGPEDNEYKCNGCIFGQAFQLLGVEKENLDSQYPIQDLIYLYSNIVPPLYWIDIQAEQDYGKSWGSLKSILKGCKNET